MGAERDCTQTKNERNAPIKFPSFVYRQDGHELSYLIVGIVSFGEVFVKQSCNRRGDLV